MGCNCKNKMKFEDEYGEREELSPIGKLMLFLTKVAAFVLVIAMGIVVTPIVLIVAIYKVFFGKNKGVMIPKFVTESLKSL